MRTPWAEPLLLAAALTLLNAAKPAAVDDAAYLIFAKHLAAHPADPYGFELFWYREPEPAMYVLLPPVLPYWLSLGYRVTGDHLFLWKLTLFPFAAALAVSLASLLRRFAPDYWRPMLAMTVLGPAVLPTFGVMLDVPALALALSAVACFVRGGWGSVVASGLLAGLAMQTKYTATTVLPVLVWYGLLNRRIGSAVVAVGVAVGVFAGWELWLFRAYGESHFLHHAGQQTATLADKLALFQPMLGQLGALAFGVWLVAASAAGVPRWVVAACASVAVLGIAAACALPASAAVLVPGKLDLPKLVFVTVGAHAGVSVLLALARTPWDRDTAFVAGWLLVELAGYFALTPFPAARRVIGLSVVGGIVAARCASRCRPPAWVPVLGIAAGVGLFALDAWDALPEKEAAAVAPDPGPHAVWFNGHWGFQYYCDRRGMLPVIPGRSELQAGDWLVFPVIPDDVGFYRPYHGGAKFEPDPDGLEPVAEFVWDDRLSATTIPPMYGGAVPLHGRDHPRLRVVVYRVTRDWRP